MSSQEPQAQENTNKTTINIARLFKLNEDCESVLQTEAKTKVCVANGKKYKIVAKGFSDEEIEEVTEFAARTGVSLGGKVDSPEELLAEVEKLRKEDLANG
jgi:hypothetical protein